jgi:four helix bundle protein
MPTFFRFKDSRLWQKAMDMAISVNQVMRQFPEKERSQSGLCSQLLEASIRVPSRIAESDEPFMRHPEELLQQARYHLTETELLLDMARYQGYISFNDRQRIAQQCGDLRSLLNQQIRGIQAPEYVISLRDQTD